MQFAILKSIVTAECQNNTIQECSHWHHYSCAAAIKSEPKTLGLFIMSSVTVYVELVNSQVIICIDVLCIMFQQLAFKR